MRFEFGEHLLDVDRQELRRGGEQIAVEPQVFDLLVYLVQNRDRVVSRDDLIDAVWGGRIVSDSAVTTRLNAARRAVGDSGAAQAVIRTVARKGVRFIAEVREQEPSTPAPWLVRPAGPETTRQAEKASILVLPFRNATSDPAQEYFTDAVTSDLTVDLSRMRDIVVISAATALTYKGSALDPRQIGRELGVRYLVVGSIARIGDLVRTNVQLLDAASGEQLWGDRFENRFVDLGGLEDAITGRIAASLNIQLVRAEGRRADQVPQPDALDLRLRATSLLFSSVAPEHTLATRQLLQRSAALDPSSAETWARLGDVIASDYLTNWNDTGEEQLQEAEEAIRRALLIDPNHALAHLAHGIIQRARGEHYSALEAFSRAIELDRNFAWAYAQKGNQLILVGRPAEAPPFVEQAIRLSPHDPSIGMFHWIIGRALFFTEEYQQAIPWFRKSVESRPNLWFNRLYLVSACALADMPDQATRALSEFNRRFSNPAYTLAVVEVRESATPNDDPTVVAARAKFHQGLLRAGMPER
ncbi:MAG TPA: winged helix-turn-helix domain-containing protein [Stellaceae bacterium]|nr:winged helix-turn-helix domain-containing protein [Stellaceae bacterium]